MLQRDDRDDPLLWLGLILWPDGRTTLAPAGERAPDGAEVSRARWWASPSAITPKILIPADAPAAARRAVRRYHDGFNPTRRLRSLAAEVTMAVPGVAKRMLRSDEVIVVGDGQAARGVIEWLAELLEVPDLVVAVGLSIPKSNRKPVLQLLDSTGRCLGWAKVGWNPISEALVANEARWLDRPGEGSLVMPSLLHDTELCGRRVVVTSSVEASRLPRRRPDALPPMTLFRAVAARGRRDVVPIERSPWWYSVEAVLDQATGAELIAVQAAFDACQGLRFEVGAWHGDLTPWNLMTVGRQVQLIDWELAADGAPVGFDLCHFHTQVATEIKGLDAGAALDRSARLSPQGLAALGVDPRNRSAVWHLYLVELIRRRLALRGHGYPGERLHLAPAALDRLGAAAERSASPRTQAERNQAARPPAQQASAGAEVGQ